VKKRERRESIQDANIQVLTDPNRWIARAMQWQCGPRVPDGAPVGPLKTPNRRGSRAKPLPLSVAYCHGRLDRESPLHLDAGRPLASRPLRPQLSAGSQSARATESSTIEHPRRYAPRGVFWTCGSAPFAARCGYSRQRWCLGRFQLFVQSCLRRRYKYFARL
jgi:hypothetical protein